ncbi:MAG TPA: HAD-IA family hydrolase [Terriglobia bacterium]|nr:HAD-IA family hydrolase [Terriglobia bacterium]
MKYDVVLFDAAETLFTTRGTVGEIYGVVAQRYGSTSTPEEIQSAFIRQFRHSGPLTTEKEKDWWKDVVHRVFEDVGMVSNFDRFFDDVYEQFRDSRGWRLFPETLDVLEELRRLQCRLGVISNFDSRVYSVLESLKILSYFDSITISSETGFAKPHPEIFKAAIRAAGVPVSRILFVGDNLADDVQAGAAAGLHTILIDRHGRYSGSERVPVIQNLRQVLNELLTRCS